MIEFCAVSKSFGPVRVLRDVTFQVAPGRTVGLVGENGAGKSTLMNLAGGNLRPDTGSLKLDGKLYAPKNPRDATCHGIAFIHQELNLFANLSIAENIFLTQFPITGGVLINRATVIKKTAALLEQVDLQCSPETLVERLSTGECQLVEIAKALSVEARLIIFDEPTTSLSVREKERLFALMARLRNQGIPMLYISHELKDVLRMCDDVVVLRDGEVVGTGPVANFPPERMVGLMVGRSLNQLFPARAGTPSQDVVFEARQLSQPGTVHNISFKLHRGEVLGLAGLMGAGRSELARILFGLDPCRRGEVLLEGRPLSRLNPRERIRRGLAFLTENRREEGLCLEAAIADNLVLVALRRYSRALSGGLIFSELSQAVRTLREAVRLTPTAKDEHPVKTLSGGNQQKVVLGKWLLAKPKVLILDEPTRGVDVGAKYELYQLIHRLTADGSAALVISSELEELIGICDRILVMSQGEIRDELSRAEFDRERILRAALETASGTLRGKGAARSNEMAEDAIGTGTP
jgi:ribose transport system ATP-binding protein